MSKNRYTDNVTSCKVWPSMRVVSNEQRSEENLVNKKNVMSGKYFSRHCIGG